jgi:hypothetical protein
VGLSMGSTLMRRSAKIWWKTLPLAK